MPPRTLTPPRRLARAALLLLALATIAGCASRPVVLTGTVTDAYTGLPLAGATIAIGDETLTTDAAGGFSTEQWRAEDTLALSAPAYEPLSLPLAGQPGVGESGVFTVTLATSLRPNTLSGTVTDAYSDQPIAGAELVVTLDVSTTLRVATDAAGRYTLADLPAEYTVSASAADYAPASAPVARAVSLDLSLRPNTLSGTITDAYSGQPIAGATVAVGAARATSDAQGAYQVREVPADAAEAVISADGFAELTRPIAGTTALDATLRPDTLIGRLVDASTGAPIANATIIATETISSTDVAFARIDDSADGSFRLESLPERGFVQVLAPGYAKQVVEIKPGSLPSEIALEPFYVRAVYITAAVASVPRLVDRFLDLIDRTELNAIVIDIKSDLRDDLGLIYYDSQVPLARELDLSAPIIDMQALVAKAKERGIYTIARVQLFSHDNVLSDARPEWSIRLKETGEVYADYPGPGIRYAYLDPTNQNVWDYNIALGVEAAQMGFDEINYDYVRFPDWFGTRAEFNDTLLFSEPIDVVANPGQLYDTILGFAGRAHRAVNGAGAYMSVDVFGRAVLGPTLTVAQDMARLGEVSDYVCPMPYPSLWWGGLPGIEVPVRQPYETIAYAVRNGGEQMAGSYGRQRPWLQDHTDPWSPVVVEYGPAEVRAQIDATEEQPEAAVGWMLYDSANIYRGAVGGAARAEP